MPLHKTCTSATHSKTEACCFQSGLIKAESKCQLKIKEKRKRKELLYEDTRHLMPKEAQNYRGGEKASQHFHLAKDLSHWREFQLNCCHCQQLELKTEQGSSRVLILLPCWPRTLTIQLIIFKSSAQSSIPSTCWAHISPFTAFVPSSDRDSGKNQDKNHLGKEVWWMAALKSTSGFSMQEEIQWENSTMLQPDAVLGEQCKGWEARASFQVEKPWVPFLHWMFAGGLWTSTRT